MSRKRKEDEEDLKHLLILQAKFAHLPLLRYCVINRYHIKRLSWSKHVNMILSIHISLLLHNPPPAVLFSYVNPFSPSDKHIHCKSETLFEKWTCLAIYLRHVFPSPFWIGNSHYSTTSIHNILITNLQVKKVVNVEMFFRLLPVVKFLNDS